MTEPCPNKQAMQPYDCDNKSQCWEPCGELGNSEEHVRVSVQENIITILRRTNGTQND